MRRELTRFDIDAQWEAYRARGEDDPQMLDWLKALEQEYAAQQRRGDPHAQAPNTPELP